MFDKDLVNPGNVVFVYSNADYKVEIERRGLKAHVIHCDVYNWKPSSFKKMLTAWAEILDTLKEHGVNEVWTLSPTEQSARFASMLGFVHKTTTINLRTGLPVFIMHMET